MDITTQDICLVAAKELCRRLDNEFPDYSPSNSYVESDADGFSQIIVYMRYLESIGMFVKHDATIVLWYTGLGKQVEFNELILATVPLADPSCFDKIMGYYRRADDNFNDFISDMLPAFSTE